MATVVDRWKSEPERRGHGKRWQVRYRDDARHDRRRAFDRKADAVRYAREVERQLDLGRYRDPRAGEVPFGEYATGWLEARYDLRPSTTSLYQGFIANHLVSGFGGIPVGRLRPAHGREFMAAARKSGTSDSLLRKVMSLATSILESAVDDGLVADNPFRRLSLPREPPVEMRLLDREELARLLDATDPHYRTFVLTAIVTGARFGEIAGLHQGNLNLVQRTLRITEQLVEWGGMPQRAEPKTASSVRTIKLPLFLVRELEEQTRERSTPDFVFPSEEGGPIRKSNFNRRHWQPALRRADLEGTRFHSLRHSCAALLVEAGAHPKLVQSQLGHSSIRTTMDQYAFVMPGLDDRLAERLDEGLGEALAPQERPRAINA